MLSAQEISAFLESLALGTDSLETRMDPQEIFTGSIVYRSLAGWQISLFVDCNSYGGVERLAAPDGRSLEGPLLEPLETVMDNFFDRHRDLEWEVFGLGGYHGYRCFECGSAFGPPFGMTARDRAMTSRPRCDSRGCKNVQVPHRPTTLVIKARPPTAE